MPHMCEDFSADVLSALRAATSSGKVQNNSRLSREVYFSWDADQGRCDLDHSSAAGELLAFEAHVTGSPRWFALNIGLGWGKFSLGDTLVIVLDAEAGSAFGADALIRSAIDGEVMDTPLDDRIRIGRKRSISTLMHRIEPRDALAHSEAFHTLTIGLPKSYQKVSLHDLGVFVVPAFAGQMPSPITLSSYG